MKRLLYISLFLATLYACKSNSMDASYSPQVESISGTWRLIEEEQGIIGQSNWKAALADSSLDITFRNDGVVMNAKGLPACCAPTALTINGRFFEIKPATQLAANPACANVSCGNCPVWDIAISNNQLIITTCNSPRKKYVRIK